MASVGRARGASPGVTLWTRALAGHFAWFLPPAAQSQGTVVASGHLCSASGHLCLASAGSFTSCRLSGPDNTAMEKMPFQ